MLSRTSFYSQLETAVADNNSLLCIGLDPSPALIPAHLGSGPDAIYKFCVDIVDATADLVCAFKPQIAHFSAEAAETQLERLIHYIHQTFPGIPVILDAKRGDIGSTAELYAKEAFIRYDADALTVNPYLGAESLKAYMSYSDRGTVILCRTSNPDSDWLQNASKEDPLYLKIAAAAVEWQKEANVLLVAGATYPDEIRKIRAIAPNIPLLVPGVGAQGGDLQKVMEAGLVDGAGLIINASRSLIYAANDRGFSGATRAAASALRDAINEFR